MPNSSYWQNRFTQIEAAAHNKGIKAYSEIENIYQKAQIELESKINTWYQRFAINNDVSMAEARKMLNAKELKELRWTVEDYIKYGKENALNKQWIKELENASARFHISRLESLKLQTQQSLEVLYGNQLDVVDKTMRNIYSESLYRTAFEVQKGFGVGFVVDKLDENRLSKVIGKPWALDGVNFSSRIWKNKEKLINELHGTLVRNIISGADPAKAIKEIENKMNVSRSAAGRLIMTESAYFSSAAQKDMFNELDVEKYQIVATLDNRTSEICSELDGKVFDMKDYEAGVTAPPFHPNCRTTTIPYFDDWEELGVDPERIARDEEGNNYYVPADMTYKEWKREFVNDDSRQNNLQEIAFDDRMSINNEQIRKFVQDLDNMGVDYNKVSKHKVQLTENEIISAISGGDRTKGSCASLGLVYIGQKGGYNVLDFRDGNSRDFFANYYNLLEIAKLPNTGAIFESARSSITVGSKLLKKVDIGKEYYLVAGRHAAIVRKTNDGVLQYLELQSQKNSGWINFDGNPRFTLSTRFACSQNPGNEAGFMIDVEQFKESEELKVLLGYINTDVGKQVKGVGGNVK